MADWYGSSSPFSSSFTYAAMVKTTTQLSTYELDSRLAPNTESRLMGITRTNTCYLKLRALDRIGVMLVWEGHQFEGWLQGSRGIDSCINKDSQWPRHAGKNGVVPEYMMMDAPLIQLSSTQRKKTPESSAMFAASLVQN
jgi:hypothetical protein